MAKLTLADILSGYQLPSQYNANNVLIETALENTLSRDGTTPNQMESVLDMNSFRIQNLGAPINLNSAARLRDVGSGSVINLGRAIAADIGELLSIDTTQEQHVFLEGFHGSGEGGEGEFFYDSLESRANHDGGRIIDPTRADPLVWGTAEKTAWFATGGTGAGCWIRQSIIPTTKMYGAKGDDTEDDYQSEQAAVDNNSALHITTGKYRRSTQVRISKPIIIFGDGDGLDTSSAQIASGETEIICTASAGAYFIQSLTTSNFLYGVQIIDLSIDCENLGSIGVHASSISRGFFDRLNIARCTGDGFLIDDGNSAGSFLIKSVFIHIMQVEMQQRLIQTD